MKEVNIAILGLGTVGGGAFDILKTNGGAMENSRGVKIRVKRILDKSEAALASRGVVDLFAKSIDDIVSDKDISIVVETIGGIEPARMFILKALNSGKSVVTANKELLAKHWAELEAAARTHNCGLYFEASCGGGIPIIRTLQESLQGDKITELYGIINGTTNYVLTEMSEKGMDYADALKSAQNLGFAEANPTSDVEGFDAAYKLSILSSIAFHTNIPFTRIYREGITSVTAEDIKYAHELGYEVKLLAIGRRKGDSVEARVHPAFVPTSHPLASVGGAFNAVFLKGDFVGDIMLYGMGAGAHPTGSAIVSDIVKAATCPPVYCDFENNGEVAPGIEIVGDYENMYYISVTVEDKPGVLSRLASVMGKNGVSIYAATQKPSERDAHVVFLTHAAREQAILKSLSELRSLSSVISINNMIRVLMGKDE